MSSDLPPFVNPFSTLLKDVSDDVSAIREMYYRHRNTRQEASTAALLSFGDVTVDTILVDVVKHSDGVDPRNSITIWTRPSEEVKALVREVQKHLKEIEPSIWLMPEPCLHMTSMEWFHSVDNVTIHKLVDKIPVNVAHSISAGPKVPIHLDTPVLSFDRNALAITFLPSLKTNEGYTYLHYRRDLLDAAASVDDPDLVIYMRYALPSAHITIARFIEPLSPENKGRGWVEALEKVDREVVRPQTNLIWTLRGPTILRAGTVWYGGGFAVKGSQRLD
ncbi:hypothetical protein NEOLEDRAFT_798004 [Neolentinus lepideus HHB14362 ss-1]|uniref:DUF1868 domain-containing protein n=1 Tax=Neolentinus lepideus HHB14362 ss-1 TaxID=1314782 RepID=A0A165PHG1_9AGAM|nr:hypothetical protein NEOLEDRAFT_798004 [Neolentinus lepideus HHB14362 ss-1]